MSDLFIYSYCQHAASECNYSDHLLFVILYCLVWRYLYQMKIVLVAQNEKKETKKKKKDWNKKGENKEGTDMDAFVDTEVGSYILITTEQSADNTFIWC